MTLTLLPSAPGILIGWLKTQTDLAALHGGRVGTKLNATLPAIRVQRIGGVSNDAWQDAPLMQVECWATSDPAADLMVRTLVAALPLFRGTVTGGNVYTYELDSGPFYADDDPAYSTNARYIITVRLLVTS